MMPRFLAVLVVAVGLAMSPAFLCAKSAHAQQRVERAYYCYTQCYWIGNTQYCNTWCY